MAKNKTPFRAGRTMDALYENMEILTGQRGKGSHKAVTAAEVSQLKGTVTSIIRSSGSGSNGETVETAHAPINAKVFAGFSSVLVSWDAPTFKGFAHAEIWRGTSNNLSQAVLIGTTPATVFSDIVDLGTGWYYWIRFVNSNDNAGPYHDVSGLYAQTNIDISDVIDDLGDQLANSQLVQQLQSDIDTNRSDFESADTAISAALDEAKAELDTTIARVESEYQAADSNINASISGLETAVADGDSALAQKIEQVESELEAGDSRLTGSLLELERVAAKMHQVISMSIRQLNASYKTVSDTEKAVTNAKITQTQQVIADAEQALAQQITELEAAYQLADNTINANLTSLEQTVATSDQALSERIDLTNATVGSVSATVSGHSQAIAEINDDGSVAYQAMWNQKTSAGKVTAGIGLIAGSDGTSQCVVSASQFFVFNPSSPSTLTPAFAIDSGKVIIPEALIEKATISILNAQTIVADQVVSGISMTSPTITGGLISGANIRGSSDAGFGQGGAYNGYKTFISSAGVLQTERLYASGNVYITGSGYIGSNMTIYGRLSGVTGDFTGEVRAEGGVYGATQVLATGEILWESTTRLNGSEETPAMTNLHIVTPSSGNYQGRYFDTGYLAENFFNNSRQFVVTASRAGTWTYFTSARDQAMAGFIVQAVPMQFTASDTTYNDAKIFIHAKLITHYMTTQSSKSKIKWRLSELLLME